MDGMSFVYIKMGKTSIAQALILYVKCSWTCSHPETPELQGLVFLVPSEFF